MKVVRIKKFSDLGGFHVKPEQKEDRKIKEKNYTEKEMRKNFSISNMINVAYVIWK